MSFLFLFVAVNVAFLGMMGVLLPDADGQHLNLRRAAGLLITAGILFLTSFYFKLDEIHKTVKNDGKQTTNTPKGVRRKGSARLVSRCNDSLHKDEA